MSEAGAVVSVVAGRVAVVVVSAAAHRDDGDEERREKPRQELCCFHTPSLTGNSDARAMLLRAAPRGAL